MPEIGKEPAPQGSLLPFTVTRPVTSKEMSIALGARDAELYFARELTNSNLIFRRALPGEKSSNQFHLKQDKRRTSLDPESGHAI
ncbi:MAG TPA: hypothetical protein VEL71_06650 [Candidatus Dormibacteraeota bacterium]|nr:hypothetical protein [Candidatus Dormibacteraeota bacterium]